MVIATQNPIEHEGTYPLPEAQLDRFIMKLSIGYPEMTEELSLFDRIRHRHPIEDLKPVCTPADLLKAQSRVCDIPVDGSVREYILQIVHSTREHASIELGASPRGSLVLFRAAQALAALRKRDYVIPDDVKQAAYPVLQHRIILKSEASLRRLTAGRVLREILTTVPAPVVA